MDVAFHSETVSMTTIYEPYKKMICDIAIDAVRILLKEKEQVISADYQVEEGIRMKGKELGLLMVKNTSVSNDKDAGISNVKNKPDLYYDIMKQKNDSKKPKTDKENQEAEIEEEIQENQQKIESELIICESKIEKYFINFYLKIIIILY